MNPFAASSVITAIVSFVMSFFVIAGDRKSKTNQVWATTTFLLGLWSLGLYGVVSSESSAEALRWQYLLDASASLIPVGFFSFVIYLLGREKSHRYILPLAVLVGVGVSMFSFTKYFKVGMTHRLNFEYWIEPGPFYAIFPITFIAFVAYALFLLVREYRRTTDPMLRSRIRYVLGAQLIGFGGGITNFLPQFVNIYPIGNYFIAFYMFFISYSILQTGMFNLKLLATEVFIFSVWMFTLARVFLASSLQERIVDVGLFLSLVFFGLLLIRSVRHEVRQREELQVLYEKVNNLSRFKTQLLSLASHQLRAPLGAIKGFVELLEEGEYGPIDEKPRETLVKIRHSAQELLDLINMLLDFRKVEEGKMDYQFQRLDISDMVKAIAEEMRPLAMQRGLTLAYASPPPIFVNADLKVSQIIRNLVDNAIKYTPQGGIMLHVLGDRTRVELVVEDTGLGISPETMPHLFEEFTRDSGVKTILGTGLGLYIAKKIAEAHGGTIRAESPGPGKGSRFILTLPVDPPAIAS